MSFNPGGGGGIAGATDVALSNPANDQVLSYNSGVAKWGNQAVGTTHTHATSAITGLDSALTAKFTAVSGAKVIVAQDFTAAGTTRCTARTDVSVRWRGPVEPTNMIIGDEWYVTTS